MGLPTHGLNWDCQAEKILKSFLVRVCCSANRFLHPVSNRYACPAEIGFHEYFSSGKKYYWKVPGYNDRKNVSGDRAIGSFVVQ